MRGFAVFHILLLCQCWTWAHSKADNDAAQTLDQGLQVEIQGVETNQAESTNQTNGTVDLWAELKELRDMTIELKTDLKHYLSRIEKLEQEKLDLEVRISSAEKEMEEIKSENADQPKVAFSLGLTNAGRLGPYNTDITLRFSKIFKNYGQAYNPDTGNDPSHLKWQFWYERHSGQSSFCLVFLVLTARMVPLFIGCTCIKELENMLELQLNCCLCTPYLKLPLY
ncbi:uncharacterized protein LOC107835780 [Poecilia formosa]|uniref:uncharacterized protein LOC107835780 n=1 Tax=Poecilia formosa TaxID=48698 RepID=UPI0007B8E6A9|nr:PREDICTED: uncharacterized protein LOC107835780 [Poecilia formosa]